jgi:RNA polymerase sigma-70 factor (ECF subfamily)
MSHAQDRDEWLMVQVAAGRRECLETLVRRYATPLLTLIVRMIGNRHRGEELFQDAFLAVWVKRRQYQFPRPFKPWLYGIAVNACCAGLRQRAGPVTGILEEDDWWKPPAPDPEPSIVLVATETATLVASAVQQLPPRQRSVVVLRIWGELAYAEIAQALACTETTVRSNMHHGLAALRRYLEPRLR